MPSSPSDAEMRQQSRLFGVLTITLTVMLGMLVVARDLVLPLLVTGRAEDWDAQALGFTAGEQLIVVGPALFYLLALGALVRTFGELAEERPFGPALVRGVNGLGQNLIWGGMTAILIAPLLARWTQNRPGGFDVNLELESVVILLVGAALALLARLLRHAVSMEAELDEII
jgi:hypothetical protein